MHQAMATDLSRLNMAFGNEPSISSHGEDSLPLDIRQTERDMSAGCSSPSHADCFNPFMGPRLQPQEALRGPSSSGSLPSVLGFV